jgi:hypothetical protein
MDGRVVPPHTNSFPMNTKLAHSERVLNACGIGDCQLTMGGICTLKVRTKEPLTDAILRDALYRAIAKNSRLSILLKGNIGQHQAPTLDLLKPRYAIERISKPLTVRDLQEHTQYTLNVTFGGSELPWEVKMMVCEENDDAKILYLRIAMHHALSDGHGLVMIAKGVVEGLHDALKAGSPLDLSTKVASHGLVIEDLHSVVDKRFLPHTILWPFLFVWRFTVGLYFLLTYTSGFLIPSRKFSGTIDPEHDYSIGKPHDVMSGVRLLELDDAVVAQLRTRANKVGGSVASVLSVAGMAAYKAYTEKYGIIEDHFSQTIVVNSRPLISDHSLVSQAQGSCTYPIIIEHRAADHDHFWTLVRNVKRKINFRLSYLSPFIRLSKLVPVSLAKWAYQFFPPSVRRNQSLLLSNVGSFETHHLDWAPNIHVESVIGSANSYWIGNRCLFQMTAFTIDGKMRLSLVYPTNMVTAEDFDYYCNAVISILQNAAVSNHSTTIGELRKASEQPQIIKVERSPRQRKLLRTVPFE